MLKSTSQVSVKEISPGTYRVNARRGRSAISGQFITKTTAKRHPGTAVNEANTKGKRQ